MGLALREDIPWRQWNHWVREKIVTYLRDNHRIAAPQPGPGQYYNQQPPQGYYNQNAQPMYPSYPQQQPSYYNVNVQMQPQKAPDWNVPPQQAGAPPPGPNGQKGQE